MISDLRERLDGRGAQAPSRLGRRGVTRIGGAEAPAWLELRGRVLGRARISRVTTDGAGSLTRLHRGERGAGAILVHCERGRVVVEQDRRSLVTGPGGMAMVDCTRPYRVTMTGAMCLTTVHAQHTDLGLIPDATRAITATALSGPAWLSALSVNTFTSLAENLEQFEGAAAEAMGLTVTRLATGLFALRLADHPDDPAAARQLLLLKVLRHTGDQLGVPSLVPSRVAAHFGISLRHLQVLFAELGTSPARWIRDERLTRLHADLTNPRFKHLTVAALGENWGMVGASQVSRLFRARYGVTPSEFRRQPPPPPAMVRALMAPHEFDLAHVAQPVALGASAV